MESNRPDRTSTAHPLRWWLCGLLFVATGLSFLDRQVLSNLAPQITAELQINDEQYSHVTNAFLVSYAVMFLVGGRLLDAVGTRLGLALAVGVWSLASALHAVVRSGGQLAGGRFLLGVGEGACFPGAAKGVAEWFGPRERALAMGLAIGGSSLGSMVAPPLSVRLSHYVGWRGVFLATGLIGATWVLAWWWLTRGTVKRDDAPANRQSPRGAAEKPRAERLGTLAGRLDVWGLGLMRFLVDPVFYFYMFWIPKYLHAERGLALDRIGDLAWIPYLALGISNVAGGWASDLLIRAGLPVFHARRWVMALAALLTMASGLAGLAGTAEMAVAMMAVLMFAHGFWITNYITIISERFPKGAVGTVTGFSGAVGTVGGMLANTAIGLVVTRYSYGPVWLASGILYPLAFVVLLLTVPSQKQRDDGE